MSSTSLEQYLQEQTTKLVTSEHEFEAFIEASRLCEQDLKAQIVMLQGKLETQALKHEDENKQSMRQELELKEQISVLEETLKTQASKLRSEADLADVQAKQQVDHLQQACLSEKSKVRALTPPLHILQANVMAS